MILDGTVGLKTVKQYYTIIKLLYVLQEEIDNQTDRNANEALGKLCKTLKIIEL